MRSPRARCSTGSPARPSCRFPVLGDLARSVRFAWFDQPLGQCRAAAGVPGAVPERRADRGSRRRTRAVDLPSGRRARSDPGADRAVPRPAARGRRGYRTNEPMLEVLIRRHYRDFALEKVCARSDRRTAVRRRRLPLDDRPTHLVSTSAEIDELTPASALVRRSSDELGATRPAGQQSVVDLYLTGRTLRSPRTRRPPPSPGGWTELPFAHDGSAGRRRDMPRRRRSVG